MKKILLAAAAALAITSCSQNEEFDESTKQAEISFGTMVSNAPRANITNSSNFAQFKVHSYVTTGAYTGATSLGNPLMNGIEYTKEDEVAPWTPDDLGKYYWPMETSGQLLQFFAYPSDLIKDYAIPTGEGAVGYPSFTYTMETTSDKQKDLVVAHAGDMKKTSPEVNNGQLTLSFKHILTRINFAFDPEGVATDYIIESITISGIKGGTAKYTFDGNNGSWNITGAETNYAYPITQSTTLVANKNYYMLGNAEASLMLYPQAVAGKKITINYGTTVNGVITFKGEKTVTLPDASEWTIGQNLLYVLALPLGATEITVTPVISEWPSTPTESTH